MLSNTSYMLSYWTRNGLPHLRPSVRLLLAGQPSSPLIFWSAQLEFGFTAKFRSNYGPGPRTALRSAVSIWAIFWAVPMMALQPMHLFPDSLIFTTIVVGVL